MPIPPPNLGEAWTTAMRRGDHPTAWQISDTIRTTNDPATRDDPTLPYHLRWVWDGRPFDGKNVLVRCYHGLGDTIQFARYLPPLSRQTQTLTLEAQPELIPLLATIPGITRLIPFDPANPTPPSACDLEIMELPAALRIPPNALPPPYLQTTPKPRPPATIGLCWQGGSWDPTRSIPPATIAPLAQHPCLSLCPTPTTLPVLNPEGCPPTIPETAALIAALHLVITVDTMVAHLAGALGIPTWLLLKHNPDWRWMDNGTSSPWYPAMRLYRQPAPGDWTSLVQQVTQHLTQAFLTRNQC